jgi:tetratricopeptide (TPR) repeat protein
MQAFQASDFATAERVLRDVVTRAPATYQREFVGDDGSLHIKFWGQDEFIYYVTRHRSQPNKQNIVWSPSAYPRALYYLGYLCVHQRRADEALRWLDAGMRLEPHPLIRFEKANVLLRLRRFDEAAALFQSVLADGDEVIPAVRAMAMRGTGFVLIEQQKLDDAEHVFRESLKLDPDSGVARNELRYIANLRAGAPPARMESIQTTTATPPTCVRCGTTDLDGGKVGNVEGRVVYMCKRCLQRLRRKWWQFWK